MNRLPHHRSSTTPLWWWIDALRGWRRGLAGSLALVLLLAVGAAGLPYAWCASMQRSSCCCHASGNEVATKDRSVEARVERACCETRSTDALPVGAQGDSAHQPQLATALTYRVLLSPEPAVPPRSEANARMTRARGPPPRHRRAIDRCIALQRFHC